MNRQEVAGVLAYFGAAFPNMDITHDTADVWANELADIDPDLAPEAMRAVVKESEFAPTVARFREAARVVAYQRRQTTPYRALEEGPGEQMPSEIVADLRSQIAKWTAGGSPRRDENRERGKPIDRTRCPRCGENTLPYTATLDPKPVDRPLAYEEIEPA